MVTALMKLTLCRIALATALGVGDLAGAFPLGRVVAELSGFAEKHDVPDVWCGWVLGEDYGFLSSCAGVFVPYGSLLP